MLCPQTTKQHASNAARCLSPGSKKLPVYDIVLGFRIRSPFFRSILCWHPDMFGRKQRIFPHAPKLRPKSKKMSLTAVLTLFLFLLPLAASAGSTISSDVLSAYDALEGFNFPMGLLPKGALGYELEPTTGKFRAFLNDSCSFSIEGSYALRYKSTISGCISRNRLASLSGISVKVLFLWLNIVEVVRNEDVLEFSVGIASASFPIDSFYECPQCGCGFDCDTTKVRKLKLKWNPFVSSV